MEENNAPVEQPNETSGSEGQSKESVAYETYRKTVSAEKAAKEKAQKLEQELQQMREAQMQAEGKKDELLESYQKKAQTLEQQLKEKEQRFAWSTLTGEIEREAMKAGCLDPKKLIRLLDDDDLKSIEVGDNFSINKESLSAVIEKSKKENHFLFNHGNKRVADGAPGKEAPNARPKTEDEIYENYLKSLK